jgi:hypothetical protein
MTGGENDGEVFGQPLGFLGKMGFLGKAPEGRGLGRRGSEAQEKAPPSEPPVLLPHSASKTRVNALMGDKGRSVHASN